MPPETENRFYILDEDNHAVPVDNALDWATWFEANRARRIVKQESVGPYWISTVFLGLDHNWFGGLPLLFETMTFSGDSSSDVLNQDRCSTWKEAEEMHRKMVDQTQRHLDG